jgi:hypothetical protein
LPPGCKPGANAMVMGHMLGRTLSVAVGFGEGQLPKYGFKTVSKMCCV